MASAVDPPKDSRRGTNVPAIPDAGLRASDDERNQIVELLSEQASAGRLTLSELEERVGLAYAARTRAELAALTEDLPTQPPTARQGKVRRWFVSIMGGATRRGRMRLSQKANVVAVMGGDDIDLREAEIDGEELTINVFVLMGGASIYVPDGVDVELLSTAIIGGSDERGSNRAPRPGAPLIRVRALALMGGIDVWRLPAEARELSLKKAIRAAKKLEQGKD